MPTIGLNACGTIFIQGINEDHPGSNAAGKSSLINSLKEILFGKNDTGYAGNNVINKHKDWQNGMFGAVWLTDYYGNMWRIFAVRKWKGNPPFDIDGSQLLTTGATYTGTDIFLEKLVNNVWVDERPTSQGNKTLVDTQKKIIEEVVGMTYEQFSAYVCLGQEAESALVSGTSGSREKIIQAVADISIWNKAVDVVKIALNNKELELSNIQNRAHGVQTAMNSITVPIEQEVHAAQKVVTDAETEWNLYIENIKEASKVTAMLQNRLESLKNGTIDQGLDILIAEERHSRERYEEACVVEKPPPEIDELAEKMAVLRSENRKCQVSIDSYNKLGVGKCSRCGQKVTKKYLDKEIDVLVDLISDQSNQLENIEIKHHKMIDNHDSHVEKVRAEAKLTLEEEIHHLENRRAELIKQKEEYSAGVQLLHDHEQKILHLVSSRDMAGQNINIAKTNLAQMMDRVDERDKIAAEFDTLVLQMTNIASEIEHYKWTERHLKKIRLQEYGVAIDRLNQLLSQRLQELWPEMSAMFVTASDTTRGTGVKQQIDLVINTVNKSKLPAGMLSGGEKKVLVIAIFLSMAQLAKECGNGLNISSIDELDNNLDDSNTDRLIYAFEAVAENNSTCLVISHNFRLHNTMRFDDVWTVRKSNEFATIEFGSQPMRAAA
ncbi:hypothetical protein KAR91_08015 [Candidatus Pacearchaeota archaeon]|nr:hypothetical protein [Candidatus Pacearchaeota archaeon]